MILKRNKSLFKNRQLFNILYRKNLVYVSIDIL